VRTALKTSLYGLWRLDQACAAGYVVMVEGASECHTLWFHGVPAIGLPGCRQL
jgi:putative DNA primase/helicase